MNKEELTKILPILSTFSWSESSEKYYCSALEKMIEESKGRTKKLDELFGCVGKYEQFVSLPTEDIKELYEFLVCVLPKEERELLLKDVDAFKTMLKTNKMPSGKKFGKHLLDAYYSREGLHILSNYYVPASLHSIVVKLPNMKSDWNKLTDFDLVVKSAIEDAKNDSGIYLGMGWDYPSMLNSLSSPNFRSCMSTHNVREKGFFIPYSLCYSGNALTIYIRKGTAVIGRCIVLFTDNYQTFVVKPLYGSIKREHVDIVLDFMMKKISDTDWFIRNGADSSSSPLCAINTQFLYKDPSIMEATCRKVDNVYVQSLRDTLQDVFVCLECGVSSVDTTLNERGMCALCVRKSQKECKICGATTLDEDLCNNCLTAFDDKKCTQCGKYNAHGHGGMCIKCMLGKECNLCRRTQTTDLHEVEPNLHICDNCVKELATYQTCRFCGDEDVMIRNGYVMCNHCYINLLVFVTRIAGNMYFSEASSSTDTRESKLNNTYRNSQLKTLNHIDDKHTLRDKYIKFLKEEHWQFKNKYSVGSSGKQGVIASNANDARVKYS